MLHGSIIKPDPPSPERGSCHSEPDLNFVVRGLLGRGVAATTRFDPQAKGLGEFLRARVVPVPERLVS